MKLWEIRGRLEDGPWRTHGDKVVGFIVRAETEADARRLARDEAGEEGGYVWLESKFSTCTELVAEGDPGVVMADLVPPGGDGFATGSGDTIRK